MDTSDDPSRPDVVPGDRPERLTLHRPLPPGASWGDRLRTYRPLLLIAAVALVVRLVFVFAVHPTCEFDREVWAPAQADYVAATTRPATTDCFPVANDALYLYMQGRMIADGKGFSSPLLYVATGNYVAGSAKPPLFPLVIAGMTKAGVGSPDGVRAFNALAGAAAVALLGLVGWRLGGRRAGIIAAVLAAAYPMLWINDYMMLNDSLYPAVTAVVILGALRFAERPDIRRAAALGALLGLATFTRSEASNLFVLLLVPLVWFRPGLPVRRRVQLLAAAGATGALLLLPWLGYNLSRFHQPTYLSTGLGSVLMNGSCDLAYYGESLGYLDYRCFDIGTVARLGAAFDPALQNDESDIDLVYRERAVQYIADNARRVPIVAAARVGRIFELYQPVQNTRFNDVLEQRGRVESWAGTISYFLLLPLGLAGLRILHWRRVPLSPFLGFAASVAVAAMLSFGVTRFRVPVEAVLVVLAGVSLDVIARYVIDPRRRGAGAPRIDWARVVPRPSAGAWRRPRWIAAEGAAAVVVLVLLWSATATTDRRISDGDALAASRSFLPVATTTTTTPGQGGGGGAGEGTARLCRFAQNRSLLVLDRYNTLTRDGIPRLMADFRGLLLLAPPELRPVIQRTIATLQQMQASDLDPGAYLRTLAPEARAAVFSDLSKIFDGINAQCGG